MLSGRNGAELVHMARWDGRRDRLQRPVPRRRSATIQIIEVRTSFIVQVDRMYAHDSAEAAALNTRAGRASAIEASKCSAAMQALSKKSRKAAIGRTGACFASHGMGGCGKNRETDFSTSGKSCPDSEKNLISSHSINDKVCTIFNPSSMFFSPGLRDGSTHPSASY